LKQDRNLELHQVESGKNGGHNYFVRSRFSTQALGLESGAASAPEVQAVASGKKRQLETSSRNRLERQQEQSNKKAKVDHEDIAQDAAAEEPAPLTSLKECRQLVKSLLKSLSKKSRREDGFIDLGYLCSSLDKNLEDSICARGYTKASSFIRRMKEVEVHAEDGGPRLVRLREASSTASSKGDGGSDSQGVSKTSKQEFTSFKSCSRIAKAELEALSGRGRAKDGFVNISWLCERLGPDFKKFTVLRGFERPVQCLRKMKDLEFRVEEGGETLVGLRRLAK